MSQESPRDPTFARFAFAVITVALVVVVLGLTGIYYYFRGGGTANPDNPFASLFKRNAAGSLAPNQVMLYYTSDGKQLVSTVADVGTLNMLPGDKARKIVESLVAGKDTAGLKSPIPAGTQVVNVFLKDNMAF